MTIAIASLDALRMPPPSCRTRPAVPSKVRAFPPTKLYAFAFLETIGAETSASGTCENHGDHLAHESDCSKFNRCVWGRLEQMHCPAGTVFNPRLSVCDYPDQVPGCSSTGAPALVTSPL